MYSVTDYLGFTAATCTTAAFLPQAFKVWQQRAAAGISFGMYVIFVIGVALWLGYGILLGAWPIIVANGLTLLLAASILFMKWYFERPDSERKPD
jgi:MtN3 and saliva related transmembrane protein